MHRMLKQLIATISALIHRLANTAHFEILIEGCATYLLSLDLCLAILDWRYG